VPFCILDQGTLCLARFRPRLGGEQRVLLAGEIILGLPRAGIRPF